MKNLNKLITALSIVVISLPVSGQFSRQQAINLVLSQVIEADSAHVNVFASLDSFPNSDSLALDDFTWLHFSYANNWVFFI